jgi:RNA polymerase sigma-70 factor (ECF subfamily)
MTLRGRDAERETAPSPFAEAARSGDRIAFSAATREDLNKQLLSLIPSLRAFARVLTRNPSEVDDLVQDTLVKAISNIHQFTPGTNLRAWLFTIERNTFYTAHQQRRRHPAAPLDEDRVLSVSPTQEWSVRMSAVQAAVLQLPAEQREALLLVAGAGMTYDEAAVVCECALGTIKSRINRARHRLEELLEIDGAAFFESSSPSS